MSIYAFAGIVARKNKVLVESVINFLIWYTQDRLQQWITQQKDGWLDVINFSQKPSYWVEQFFISVSNKEMNNDEKLMCTFLSFFLDWNRPT